MVVFKTSSGVVRDREKLFVKSNVEDSAIVFAMLASAKRENTNTIHVDGSEEFKKRAAILAGKLNLDIQFDDKNLDALRKENTHRRNQHARGANDDQGREPPREPTRTGPIYTNDPREFQRIIRKDTFQQNFGGFGPQTSPTKANDLRTLSRSTLVFHARRTEVLEPSYERHRLDNQRTDRAHELRRSGNGTTATPTKPITPKAATQEQEAAIKYCQERSRKRMEGINIPPHQVYTGKGGSVIFLGVRHVDNQSLLLFQINEDRSVVVKPNNPDKPERTRGPRR